MQHQRQIEAFHAMLAKGQDNTLLRFGLGQALLADGHAAEAVPHLQAALGHDARYSAAWKLLGRALAQSGDADGARAAYTTGIEVAEARGDIQALKEMRVFLKRLA
ncbi:hypothetical protein IGB42_02352 [Andreprevotia sp. IGB-42]|uniref:tetratricopeptide repeat protein n=1 Tax=Andreprevotia sp. IGB-42 TaxID=2497473 RepID=UPI001359ED4F|nr:tetratricopeptide repeat protein [Andreprevotia sp. IGB-42]KAF0812957.1 hypothetical protein IGB42_02352 [Andreprevotia sp. IGB-42]